MVASLNTDVRKWLANKLASWARRIYPQSEEVMSFWADRMMEQVIYGHSAVKITAVPTHEMIVQMHDGSTWVMENSQWTQKT